MYTFQTLIVYLNYIVSTTFLHVNILLHFLNLKNNVIVLFIYRYGQLKGIMY